MEIKKIEGYNDRYTISENGVVFDTLKQRELKQTDKHGYKSVRLSWYKEGVIQVNEEYVHRLVAMAFIPRIEGKNIINHKDENPSNNNKDNLEWCDQKYNCNYGTRNQKIGNHRKPVRCLDTGKEYSSVKEASIDTGIYAESISDCCRGEYKSGITHGLRFEYIAQK